MYLLLGLMTLGILIGCLSAKHTKFIFFTNKIVMLCIYALLFLLGVQAGSNTEIIANITTLGGIALLLTAGAVLGSLLAAKLLFHYAFHNFKKQSIAPVSSSQKKSKVEGKAFLGSLYILILFLIGSFLGFHKWLANHLIQNDYALYALYGLLFFVGISIGADKSSWQNLKHAKLNIVLVPLSIIVGSLLGSFLFSFFFSTIAPQEAMAVGAGFGYYSLSSVLITQISGEELGTIALLSNIIREISTLIATPIFVRYFGKLAGIASGGATSMDTTLPIITAYSGKEWAIISIFNGIVLTIIVPILVPFILSL
jgi:uncharacterized membrane protein YbjE (DUF340 family)